MKSKLTREFRDRYRQMPAEVRKSARDAYAQFRRNPQERGLGFKRVHSGQPIVSARVGRRYRVVGVQEGDLVVWFWIGSHAEYDQLLKRL